MLCAGGQGLAKCHPCLEVLYCKLLNMVGATQDSYVQTTDRQNMGARGGGGVGTGATWHGALVSGPLSLHEAGQPSQQPILTAQLLPQLHDGIQVVTGE